MALTMLKRRWRIRCVQVDQTEHKQDARLEATDHSDGEEERDEGGNDMVERDDERKGKSD